MVRNHSILKFKAEKLRRGGNSYSQISLALKIPKGTLSNWFSGKSWSNKISKKLTENQRSNSNNLIAANRERKRLTELRHSEIIKSAKSEYLLLRNDNLFLTGLSLYWGEGEKTNSGRVSVINTDPEMILVIANFYRRCLGVTDDKLRVGLFIYEDLDEGYVTNYWSKCLKIPKRQFIKTQVLKSRTKLTHRKSKYGICSLYFSNTAQSIKIGEWIRLLGQEMNQSQP